MVRRVEIWGEMGLVWVELEVGVVNSFFVGTDKLKYYYGRFWFFSMVRV